MCGGSIFAKLLLFSGALYGLKSEETAETPSYEDGFVPPDRLGAGLRAAHTVAHAPRVADKSAEWIVALRSSLMRDNYDYPSPAADTLAQLTGDTSVETSAESDSSEDASGGDQNGRPSAQDYNRPTPRSPSPASTSNHSFSIARPVNPTLEPSRPNRNVSRKNMNRDMGLELPTVPIVESVEHSGRRRRQRRPVASMPPRTAQNAALIDEINEQFEAKRRNYLESLYELEDQLRPVYAGAVAPNRDARAYRGADRRGGGDRGGRNLDDGIGIKPDSLPYIGHNGIRRYKVFKNEIEKLQPFVDDYLDYRNNHPEARVDAELTPWHDPQTKKQNPMTESHQEALKMTDNVKPTLGESSEHVQDRKSQWKDRFEQKSARKGAKENTKRHHRRKKQRSMYLESAGLPNINSEEFVQRYNSRRDAEALDDSSNFLSWSPSPTGLPTSST